LFRVQHIQAMPDDGGRLVAIGGVLLVHLLIATLILFGMPRIIGQRASPQEIFFIFAPKREPRENLSAVPLTSSRPLQAPIPIPRVLATSPRESTAPSPQVKGLGLSLLRCAPENITNLSPEERSQCASSATPRPRAKSGDAYPGFVKEHAVDAGTWSASIARRNTPLTAPCSTLRAIPEDVTTGRTAKVIIVDPLCVLGLTKGSKP